MRNRLFLSLAIASPLAICLAGCATTTAPYPGYGKATTLEKVGSSLKSGTQKAVALVTPKSTKTSAPEVQPTGGKPGPNVFVAAAQMSERSGEPEKAELHYKKALALDPNHVPALVGYAHLRDRQNDLEGATTLYQRALKHSKDASIYGDQGLCYHRRGMLPAASKSLSRAVELQPDNHLYRDNLAAALVEQGKNAEALVQLQTAHGESVGHYNLGYLLVQRKDNVAALEQFRMALRKDPGLGPASHWIATLSPSTIPGVHTISPPPRVARTQPVALPPVTRTSAALTTESVAQNQQVPQQLIPPGVANPAATRPEERVANLSPARSVQFPSTGRTNDGATGDEPPVPARGGTESPEPVIRR